MLKDINDPAVEEEMERELNTIAKLDHENIVRIYGVFSVADTGNTGKLNILSDSFQIMHYVCVTQNAHIIFVAFVNSAVINYFFMFSSWIIV